MSFELGLVLNKIGQEDKVYTPYAHASRMVSEYEPLEFREVSDQLGYR